MRLKIAGLAAGLALGTCVVTAAPRPMASAAASPTSIATTPISRMDQKWWHARFEAKQDELARHAPDLLWLGDSITQNWEVDGPEQWRTFRPVWDRFYSNRHAVDLGFKGDSTCHLLWRLRNGELDHIAPRAAILLIGANNFGHIHTDADQTYAGILAVLDAVHSRLPNTQILVLGVLPSIRSAWVDQNTKRLNALLSASVTRGRPYVTYADVGRTLAPDGRPLPDRFIDPHLTPPDPPLHPTAQTQEQIALLIEPIVARMLGDHLHR